MAFPTIIILDVCFANILGAHHWKHEKTAKSYEFTAEEGYLSSAVFLYNKTTLRTVNK